jgi:hypothetical protein
MEPVQAVDERDPASVIPQQTGQVKKAQGPGPEIIGRKIMNPGIDAKDVGSSGHGSKGGWGKLFFRIKLIFKINHGGFF